MGIIEKSDRKILDQKRRKDEMPPPPKTRRRYHWMWRVCEEMNKLPKKLLRQQPKAPEIHEEDKNVLKQIRRTQ